MTTTRAHDRSHGALDEAVIEAALEALVPVAEIGAPAWADVLERAAALAPCDCPTENDDDA